MIAAAGPTRGPPRGERQRRRRPQANFPEDELPQKSTFSRAGPGHVKAPRKFNPSGQAEQVYNRRSEKGAISINSRIKRVGARSDQVVGTSSTAATTVRRWKPRSRPKDQAAVDRWRILTPYVRKDKDSVSR